MNRVLTPDLETPPLPPRNVAPLELSGATMGTSWTLRAFASADFNAQRLHDEISAMLDAIVREMSPWEDGSTLSRFNALGADGGINLSTHFSAVLDCALRVAEETDGAFDPTLGALVDLWGFGAKPPAREVPNDDEIETARAASGRRKLKRDGATLVQPGGLRLDLNGIAKGYAVDDAARIVGAAGVASFLIEIGGELKSVGVKPDGQPWWVDLERPPGDASPPLLLALYNQAVASSGDYRRTATVGGEAIAHTIDPATGRPLRGGVAAVSVLHASAMAADAYATAIQVLGAERGLAFAERSGLAAILTERTPAGFREHFSARAAAMLAE
jgi:thiamine biosynthesis lipoprotein